MIRLPQGYDKHGVLAVKQIYHDDAVERRVKFREFLTQTIVSHLNEKDLLKQVSHTGVFSLAVPTSEAPWYAEVAPYDPSHFTVKNINQLLSLPNASVEKDPSWKLIVLDEKWFRYWIGLIDCHIATVIDDREEVEKIFLTGVIQYDNMYF